MFPVSEILVPSEVTCEGTMFLASYYRRLSNNLLFLCY